MFTLRNAIRLVLAFAALTGIWLTTTASSRYAGLRKEQQRLSDLTGAFAIADPGKVWIRQLPSDDPLVWKFRVYFPPKYDVYDCQVMGRISASTPKQRRSSSSRGYGGSSPAASEYTATFAFYKEGDGVHLHVNTPRGRGRSNVMQEMEKLFDQPEALVVDVAGADEPESFATDEPIMVLRVRGQQPVADADKPEPLYTGLYFYFVPKQFLPQFELMQSGKSNAAQGKQ